MCGICGIISFNKAGRFVPNIKAMNDALAHRGPNAEGTWLNEDTALGHRRLSIIDLSDAGNQPMVSGDQRYVLVFNGEIYNFRELRNKLPNYPFKTNSDSEVILAAYSQWGKNCVTRFNGMFAFAIWDNLKKELFLVRDRMGIKPLYYFMDDEKLIFSSEVRCLLASNLVKRQIDRKSLVDYIRYQTVHAPDTIIAEIKMVMPGQYITVRSSTTKSGNHEVKFSDSDKENQNSSSETLLSSAHHTILSGFYWQLGRSYNGSAPPADKPRREIQRDILELLTRSVERRLIADVPFGAFLSGGIDSSIVVGLMASVLNQKVNTFSVTFSEKKYSESHYSQLIANRFNTNHTEIKLSPGDFVQMLPNALNSMDHPSGDGPNTWVVSKVTKEAGITMALSGLGGDELFAGYDIFKRLNYLYKFRGITKLPSSVRTIPGRLLNMTEPSISIAKIKELLNLPSWDLTDTYPLSRQILPDRKIEKLLLEINMPANAVESIVREISCRKRSHLLSTISCAEISTYLQNVLLRDTDQMSMAHALEVRVPFLDHVLVEYVLQISDNNKFPHTPKQLLVESTYPLLPKDVSKRRKMGFTLPWDYWMRNQLKSFCESHLQSLSKHDYFNSYGLMQIWKRFLNNDPLITWSRIWTLVALGNWLTNNDIE